LFLLDLSYCLAIGQHDELYAKVRTSWQDSSPQAAFDWFVTRQKQVRTDQLLAVTEAQTDLIESPIGLRKLDDADAEDVGAADSEPDTLLVIDRAEANDILTRNVIDHVFIPVTMARGRTSVEDKTTAALHQGGVEAPSAAQLALVRAEELSKTVDMGTEIKLAEFRSDCPEQALLPPWFFSNDLVSDMSVAAEFADEVDGPNHVGDGVACQRRLTNAAGPFVFPNAFDTPGPNHSIHLIEKGMAEQLPEWNAFWLYLKTWEEALGDYSRRENIVYACIDRTEFASRRTEILNFSARLYTERWGCVTTFCKCLLAPMWLLERTWSEKAFKELRQNQQNKDGWKVETLTLAIADRKNKCYLKVVIKSSILTTNLRKLCEGCPCHQHLLDGEQIGRAHV
jgi:hypothetical protein